MGECDDIRFDNFLKVAKSLAGFIQYSFLLLLINKIYLSFKLSEMKKILMGSLVLTVLAAAIITVQMSSCTKTTAQTNTVYDTVKVTIHDTICPNTLTKIQILTQKTWRVAQLMHVISGAYSSYIMAERILQELITM